MLERITLRQVIVLASALLAVLFAIGWLLYGVAAYRTGVFPRPIAVMIAISGILGYQALLSPWAVPLGLSVLALGVWMVRAQPNTASRSERVRGGAATT